MPIAQKCAVGGLLRLSYILFTIGSHGSRYNVCFHPEGQKIPVDSQGQGGRGFMYLYEMVDGHLVR